MTGIAEWLQLLGVLALLIVSYSLSFWFRRKFTYSPLRERTAFARHPSQPESTCNLKASTAGREPATVAPGKHTLTERTIEKSAPAGSIRPSASGSPAPASR